MPPPTPLHASERKLGWFMVAAIPLTVVVWLRISGISNVSAISNLFRTTVWQGWKLVLEGKWSLMSPNDLFYLLLVSSLGGAVVLVLWYLVYLFGQRRRPLPRALWSWSALYGLMPFSVGAIFLPIIISDAVLRDAGNRRFFYFIITEFALGLAIAVLGFRTWRRRRREDRAALAADLAADPARPD